MELGRSDGWAVLSNGDAILRELAQHGTETGRFVFGIDESRVGGRPSLRSRTLSA